ncbi:MAG: methyltransferase [Bdellovibrionia bacterium]
MPQGLKDFNSLQRYPVRKRELLQAWDAADELLLEHLSSTDWAGKRIVILNDAFGALTRQLMDLNPVCYTDSYLSAKAIQINTQEGIQPISDLTQLAGSFDLAVMKLPKNLSFFEDELCHLSQHLKPGAQVICGYMIKHQANTSFELLAKRIGPTHTSLAKKKARLIFAPFEQGLSYSPYPLQVSMEGFEKPFTHFSNIFSREQLDIGTRFFLQHLPEQLPGSHPKEVIWDLGCGNGIIGIAAKHQNPEASIIFSDESMMAIQSARANFENFFPGQTAEFRWSHGGEGQPDLSVDLVLCNPPFHQGTRVGDDIALEMFREARRALKPDGRLRVIGNSHLQYPAALAQLFGNSDIVARNPKFTIVDAIRET